MWPAHQLASGEIVVGAAGEKLTNHYTFYAVFNTPEEFRIVTGNRTLGTVPVDSPLLPEQHIIFGGRRWKVTEIEVEKRLSMLRRLKAGSRHYSVVAGCLFMMLFARRCSLSIGK